MTTLYWLQAGACGGDTMSLLNSDSPDFLKQFSLSGVELLYHPSLSRITSSAHAILIDQILSGDQQLDILCVEGAVIEGPDGSGWYDAAEKGSKKDLIVALAQKAGFVLALGTCASFGGVVRDAVGATGLQFREWQQGGLLGSNFKSRNGQPVINLPGCPCHPQVIVGMVAAIVDNISLTLDRYNMPVEWYGPLVHQGCTRNEYHEFRVEEENFGEKGCLFFYMGCRGPLTHGICNKALWNRRSCKTRAGVPCFGCTRPDFPQSSPFFETRNIEGVPLDLPEGMSRAHYLAYKGMAAAAAPKRLKKRISEI